MPNPFRCAPCVLGLALIACGDQATRPGIDEPGVTLSYRQGTDPAVSLNSTEAYFLTPINQGELVRMHTPTHAGVPATLYELAADSSFERRLLPFSIDVAVANPIATTFTTTNALGERALADSGSITILDVTPASITGTLSVRMNYFVTPNGPREALRLNGRFVLKGVAALPAPLP